jgi:hypothetical protein
LQKIKERAIKKAKKATMGKRIFNLAGIVLITSVLVSDG